MRPKLEDKVKQRLLKKASARIEGLLLSVFEEGSVYEANDPSRTQYLRPSSFPFCPLRFFLGLPDAASKGRRIPASMAYYVRVGHVIHNTFQEAIATHDKAAQFFVRDWKCNHCGHLHRLTTVPKKCRSCSTPFRVHEVPAHLEHTIREGNLVGHVDDSFAFDYQENEYLVVMDYKSTSTARIQSGRLPEKNHAHQLSAYSALLNKRRHVIGYVLVYIPRDNPRKLKAFPVMRTDDEHAQTLHKISRYEKQHHAALAVNTKAGVDQLIEKRPCRDAESLKRFCGECMYSKLCVNIDGDRQLVMFAQQRLQRRLKQLASAKEHRQGLHKP